MALQDYKGQLITKALKAGGTLPAFANARDGGADHLPRWKSVLTFEGKIYTGLADSKRGAEQIAAKKAIDGELDDAPDIICAPRVSIEGSGIPFEDFATIYFIDGEEHEIRNTFAFKTPNSLFIYFLNKNTTRTTPFQQQHKYKNCVVMLCESTICSIIYTIGQVSVRNPRAECHIYSTNQMYENLVKSSQVCHIVSIM